MHAQMVLGRQPNVPARQLQILVQARRIIKRGIFLYGNMVLDRGIGQKILSSHPVSFLEKRLEWHLSK